MFLLNAVLICFLKILKCHLIIPIIDITYQMLFFPMESQLEKLAAAREGRIVERLENVCMCLWTNANASQLIESPRPIQKLVTFLRAQRRWCCVGCWTRNVQELTRRIHSLRVSPSACWGAESTYMTQFNLNLNITWFSQELVFSWYLHEFVSRAIGIW
jgi:hypothetical protein